MTRDEVGLVGVVVVVMMLMALVVGYLGAMARTAQRVEVAGPMCYVALTDPREPSRLLYMPMECPTSEQEGRSWR